MKRSFSGRCFSSNEAWAMAPRMSVCFADFTWAASAANALKRSRLASAARPGVVGKWRCRMFSFSENEQALIWLAPTQSPGSSLAKVILAILVASGTDFTYVPETSSTKNTGRFVDVASPQLASARSNSPPFCCVRPDPTTRRPDYHIASALGR